MIFIGGEGRGSKRKVTFAQKIIHAMWNVYLVTYGNDLVFP